MAGIKHATIPPPGSVDAVGYTEWAQEHAVDDDALTIAKTAGLQTALDGKASTAVFDDTNAGLAPASGGGTANFLRADGVWAPPPGGGGSADVKEALFSIPYGVQRGQATVVDATVSPTSLLQVTWGSVADADENDPEMDAVSFFARPGTGQFDVIVAAAQGRIGGQYRINYVVG